MVCRAVGRVERLIGRWAVGGVLVGAGKRRRRECGKLTRLYLGSLRVMGAHNLSDGCSFGIGKPRNLLTQGGVSFYELWEYRRWCMGEIGVGKALVI